MSDTYWERVEEELDGSNGCIELAEALAAVREDLEDEED